jgi:lipid A 3-O-deacylase
MRTGIIIFLLVVQALPARAQQLVQTARVSVDNDYFDFWIPPQQRPDDNYSQGARLSWDISGVPPRARRLVCRNRSACGMRYEFGQEMYTPSIDSPTPVPGERPYAGWLYGRVAIRSADGTRARSIGLTAGFTGTLSLGEQVQGAYHHAFGFRRPLGWKDQLSTEAAFALKADQFWRLAPDRLAGFVDVVPSLGLTIGTLRTSAAAGGRARFGIGMNHPWLASPPSRATIQGFVGAHVEGVARDLFIDGNTFTHSVRVDGKPLRAEWERGLHLGIYRLAVEYAVVTQGREYRTGPYSHTYGTLAVEWTMNPRRR